MISMAAPAFDEATFKAVESVLRSGMLAQGARVDEFEKAFASYVGVKHAVAVNSGTAALHTALVAAGIGPGDEVITTPFSFIASANSILFSGACPVFADIDPATFNIDPTQVVKKIGPKTRAVLPVHLYGQTCDVEAVSAICREKGLLLIEDACQAHGAEYAGKKAGSFGIGCFSFYATKNMTTGEGGIITTDDDEIAGRARMFRNHGQSGRYLHATEGFNYRMTDVAAAIGLRQLGRLDDFNAGRIRNAALLTEAVASIKGLVPPAIVPGRKHVFHQYTVRVTPELGLSRDELQRRLQEKGVPTAVHYPHPIHKQPFYAGLGYRDHLPVAEKAAAEVMSLPVHPSLGASDLETIAGALKSVR